VESVLEEQSGNASAEADMEPQERLWCGRQTIASILLSKYLFGKYEKLLFADENEK